jgi:hypothetical protein
LNGNEWLKQQLHKEDIAFESLDNGFLWCADPDRLQHVEQCVEDVVGAAQCFGSDCPATGRSG